MTAIRPLAPDEIAQLTAEELAQLQDDLEGLYRADAKQSLESFVAQVAIPGTPTEEDDDPEILYPEKLIPAAHHKLIINAIQRIVDGEDADVDGVMIFMPPGSAKSSFASVAAPAWLLGRTKNTSIIVATYGQKLANRFGRRVRHVVRSDDFSAIMGCTITGDNQAVDDWSLTNGSSYKAIGMDGGVTGLRGDWIIIDDPVKNREEADSIVIRDKVWDSFNDDLTSRYRPGMRIFLIMCMTGDTPVLMECGQEKPLRDIRPGDRVATYDNGKVAVSTVRNWANQGPDRVFEIRMKSGVTVRANARHPFLTEEDGITKWQQTASLKKGSVILRVTGANGAGSLARRTDATTLPNAEGSACRITTKADGLQASEHLPLIRNHAEQRASGIDTISHSQSMTVLSRSSLDDALYVNSPHQRRIPVPIGAASSASIIATTPGGSEGFSVTTAISQSGTGKQKPSCSPPLSTCGIVRDTVIEIVEAGIEDVFDIEVERTENFIANGLVSHNTRWHEDDLAGRLLGENWKGQSGLWRGTDERLWNIINLPMIAEHKDDPLGRQPGEQLWAEYFVKKDFERLQRAAAKGGTAARTWSSLYQQRPAPSEGSILLRQYWREWTKKKKIIEPDGSTRLFPDPPDCEFVFLSYDTAFEDGEENDFSAMTAWGVFDHISKKDTGEEYEHMHAILLGAWEDKVQAADLADIVVEHHRVMKPSLILIEKRASGIQLAQELRRRRLPVKTWPPKGVPMRAKVPRAHAVAMMLEQGSVHYVPGAKTQRVIDQCAAFPNGTNDDLVDTVTQALKFMRDRSMFQSADDEMDKDEIIDTMNARFDARKNKGPRRLYGGEIMRPVQNERKDDDELVRNMTEGTRRRLYGGTL